MALSPFSLKFSMTHRGRPGIDAGHYILTVHIIISRQVAVAQIITVRQAASRFPSHSAILIFKIKNRKFKPKEFPDFPVFSKVSCLPV